MNFDNGHRPRQGQHNNNNKNRNRGRNNRRPGGGGSPSNNVGGNSLNRVYESNGPDVKVRGTSQTIAEKYNQLGRDAQSAGDNVMAESYFQFSEHYFRVWAAAQPVGQPAQQLRRPEDEEYDEERDDGGEGEGEGQNQTQGDALMAAEPGMAAPEPVSSEQDMDRSEQRNYRSRDNREKFRPRWQNRRDQQNPDQPRDGEGDARAAETDTVQPQAQPREAQVEPRVSDADESVSGQWEAPSFLKRPAPVAAVEEVVAAEPAAEKRVRSPRKPRAVAVAEEQTPDE